MSDEAPRPTAPRIDWQGEKAYFHDADGGVWRVHDSIFREHRHHRVPLGDPRASYRNFVAADGTRRPAQLKPGESRALTVELLAAQLQGAGYAARAPFDPGAIAPDQRGEP